MLKEIIDFGIQLKQMILQASLQKNMVEVGIKFTLEPTAPEILRS